jgi:two-component sensor histidine kinase
LEPDRKRAEEALRESEEQYRNLGLELVSLLVMQVNGTINLEVDGGTKFTITFPKANKEDS